MKIAVVQRLIPNIIDGVELSEDQTDIDREWTDTQANETDEQALEEALVLKDATGATVTVLALSDEGVDRLLRTALAKGADRAVEIDIGLDSAQARSSMATASSIAQWLRTNEFDLVLVGNQKVDDPFGSLAAFMGEELGATVVAGVTQIKSGSGYITAVQEYGEGRSAEITFSGPAVIAVQTASRPIQYVSGSKLREAMSSAAYEKVQIDHDESATDATVHLRFPEKREGGVLIQGAADGVAKLIEVLEQRNLV